MEQRLKKQIIIVLIFLLFLLVISLGIYFFYFWQRPTCFDKIQNQGEEKVDCGGPCPPCEIIEIKDPEILWVYALATKEQNYDLVARISNVNQYYAAKELDYTFSIYDVNNNLLGNKSGKTFLLPREEKYLAEFKIFASEKISKVNLTINNVKWEKVKNYEPPNIEIFEKKYESVGSGSIFAEVSGLVRNYGRIDYRNIYLIAVIFNERGEPLAVNSGEIKLLPAKQDQLVVMPWFFEINGKVARVEIEPQVNVLQ